LFTTNTSLHPAAFTVNILLYGSECFTLLRDQSEKFSSFVLEFEPVDHKTGYERKQSR
jgi:hypothetical protein